MTRVGAEPAHISGDAGSSFGTGQQRELNPPNTHTRLLRASPAPVHSCDQTQLGEEVRPPSTNQQPTAFKVASFLLLLISMYHNVLNGLCKRVPVESAREVLALHAPALPAALGPQAEHGVELAALQHAAQVLRLLGRARDLLLNSLVLRDAQSANQKCSARLALHTQVQATAK